VKPPAVEKNFPQPIKKTPYSPHAAPHEKNFDLNPEQRGTRFCVRGRYPLGARWDVEDLQAVLDLFVVTQSGW
jgi:hypothetical protein